MYASRQVRFRATIDYCKELLRDMALDARAFPGVASEVRIKSSASAPSLRARDSEVSSMGRSTPDNAGGNVKVVVRVRAFLPRGKSYRKLINLVTLTILYDSYSHESVNQRWILLTLMQKSPRTRSASSK